MVDSSGNVLYVGKAKNLKKRVSSYSRLKGHSSRIIRMIKSTRSMMFLTTETEIEALLLEQNLIKQLKPRYNVLLRDDKSFPDIMIATDHEFPKVIKSRGKRLPLNKYFGPFASASAVNQTLNYLQRVFMLRNCSDSIFSNRSRPCLQYQIKRCSAPCVGMITTQDYKKSVKDAEMFLSGKTDTIKRSLIEKMQTASYELNFEKAAVLRDKIQALTHIQGSQGINPTGVSNADLIALAMDGSQACIQIFFFRVNQNWGNRAYFPQTGIGASNGEILEAFIMQFYREREIPDLILTSHKVANQPLVVSALSNSHKKTCRIENPSKGEKIRLISTAQRNASEELARKISSFENQSKLLSSLASTLKLNKTLSRIEIYDNSHTQGTNFVGAMVVAGPEGFMRSDYRKFNLKDLSLNPGDDVGMMYHVLSRRFARQKLKNDQKFASKYPDLIIIDGGKTQVAAATKALSEHNLESIPVLGIAKGKNRNAGEENFYGWSCSTKFSLKKTNPVLFFLQRLRDEAHRFVIGEHRKKRSKAMKENSVDQIPGIGAVRKRALLGYFGSARGVKMANVSDLKKVDGISTSIAELIYNYFND